MELPVFSALRKGIRRPQQVTQATMDALLEKIGRAPIQVKRNASKAALPSVITNGEFQL